MNINKRVLSNYKKLKNLTKQKIKVLEKLAKIETEIDKTIKKLGSVIKTEKKKMA